MYSHMNIVVAVDNSQSSIDAVKTAAEDFVRTDGGSLTLLHCAKPKVSVSNGTYVSEPEKEFDNAKSTLSRMEDIAKTHLQSDNSIKTEIVESDGSVSEALSSYVNDNSYNRLYVGHRNISERSENIVGSTTKKLLGKTSIPIVVV